MLANLAYATFRLLVVAARSPGGHTQSASGSNRRDGRADEPGRALWGAKVNLQGLVGLLPSYGLDWLLIVNRKLWCAQSPAMAA